MLKEKRRTKKGEQSQQMKVYKLEFNSKETQCNLKCFFLFFPIPSGGLAEQSDDDEEEREDPFDHLGRPKFIDLPATLTPPGAKPSGLGHELSSDIPTVDDEEQGEDAEKETPTKKPRTSLDRVKLELNPFQTLLLNISFLSDLRTQSCREKVSVTRRQWRNWTCLRGLSWIK